MVRRTSVRLGSLQRESKMDVIKEYGAMEDDSGCYKNKRLNRSQMIMPTFERNNVNNDENVD
jgi:hypothetical protein